MKTGYWKRVKLFSLARSHDGRANELISQIYSFLFSNIERWYKRYKSIIRNRYPSKKIFVIEWKIHHNHFSCTDEGINFKLLYTAGCCLLSVVCCLLSVSCCLLAAGCWLPSVSCWLLAVVCWLLAVGCWLLSVVCCLLSVVCYLLSVG